MSNAIDALNSLTDAQISAYITTPESEPHIVIDTDRKVTVPDSLKRIAVQFDHNIETVTFDCPRYWDNHDMSQMKVYINYMLPDGSLDSYIVDNVTAFDDIMNFDWTIKENVTQQKGNITFLVCVKKVDSSGNKINHWNSELCSDLFVSEGLECVEQIVADHPDLITQLLTRMDTVEQINIQADEMRELHDEVATAAEEANAAKDAAVEAKLTVEESVEELHNLYSNAIVNSVSGEIVQVDDASPIEHTVKAKIRSKNLAIRSNERNTHAVDGITFTVNDDGSITANGTATSTAYYLMQIGTGYTSQIPIKKGRYTIGTAPVQGCRISIGVRDDEFAERILYYSTHNNAVTFDITSDTARFDIILCVDMGFTVTDAVFKPMLVEGDTEIEYTPYVDPSSVTVFKSGKNLLVYPYADGSFTVSGITVTMNEDGTLSLSDTATRTQNYYFSNNESLVLAPGIYTVSVGDEVVCDNEIRVWLYKPSIAKRVAHLSFPNYTKVTFEITETTSFDVYIMVMDGSTVSGKLKLQIETGDISTPYEPYMGSNHACLPDGTVEGITSLSPAMTLFTDKPGVILDIEYNKDINVALDEINRLGGGGGQGGVSPTIEVDSISGGHRVAITDVNGTKSFYVLDGQNGKPGEPGYTPVKGTDYFTAADKNEMVNSVLAALPAWTGGSY